MFIIEFDSLEEFKTASTDLVKLYDPTRKMLYTVVGNVIAIYKLKEGEEKRLKDLKPLVKARLISTIDRNKIEMRVEEFKDEIPKLLGRRLKEVDISGSGIDLIFEGGTALKIYCIGEWALSVKEAKEEIDDDFVL